MATHYPELKTFAHTTPGVVNASLEFDVQTLRPTYQLTIGLPGRSNALAIAQRLGLPQEIIEAARSEINPDDLRADKLLGRYPPPAQDRLQGERKSRAIALRSRAAWNATWPSGWIRSRTSATRCLNRRAPKASWKWKS